MYTSGNYQIRSVIQSCPTLCDPMNRSTLEMQIKTTVRYRFTLVKMAMIKKSINNKS